MFRIETGWPPPELFVMVIIARGTRGLSSDDRSASSFATSMLPLNGPGVLTFSASGQGRSSAVAPVNSMFARVVSK